MTREEMKNRLEKVLTPGRFRHSVSVMETAVRLAKKYGADIGKAETAGLMHDCARNIRGEEAFLLCEKYGIETDFISESQPELLHGPLGYYIARDVYGIVDQDILNAIRCHTTGKESMSLLEKIIFMADYIEPGRSCPHIDAVRKEAAVDLDRAMLAALDNVLGKGAYLHQDTINARNFILRHVKMKGRDGSKEVKNCK